MKMSREAYETLMEEFGIIVEKLVETGAALRPGQPFDPENITNRDLWDILLVANMDRANAEHPRHTYPGLLPRCLEFTDRNPHWLYARDGEDLDDSHIETALKRIRTEIVAARSVERTATVTDTPSVSMRM